jgi:hypothetical protein
MRDRHITERPLGELGFSREFLRSCEAMGYRTVTDILADGAVNIQRQACFSYNWLEELVSFLKENELLELLQPTPGNRSH